MTLSFIYQKRYEKELGARKSDDKMHFIADYKLMGQNDAETL